MGDLLVFYVPATVVGIMLIRAAWKIWRSHGS